MRASRWASMIARLTGMAVIAASTLGQVMSQEMPGQGRPGRPPESRRAGLGHEDPRSEKARSMMMTLKIWKLTEELKIDEKLSEKLFPRVRELDELRFRHMNEMETLNRDMRIALDQRKADDGALLAMVESAKKMRSEHIATETRQLERIFELLSPEQQARFLLLEADFHQNIRRFLRDQRRGGMEDDQDPIPE